MKTSLIAFVLLAVLAPGAHADSVKNYVRHFAVKGQSKTQGTWNNDYVQLIARPGHPLSAADKKLNATFASDAHQAVCLAPSSADEDGSSSDYETTTAVTFVSDRLLAIDVNENVSCADAAHPDSETSSHLFDRKTGQEIDIRTGAKIDDTGKVPAQTSAIDKVLTDALVAQAKIEKAARAKDGDSSCDDEYTRENLSGFGPYDISVNSKGLSVQLSPAHVDAACGFAVQVPYAILAKVAPKGSLLAELVAGATKR